MISMRTIRCVPAGSKQRHPGRRRPHAQPGAHAPGDTGSCRVRHDPERDLVDSMALYTMAFSAKYGDRTASFLDVTTREGSAIGSGPESR